MQKRDRTIGNTEEITRLRRENAFLCSRIQSAASKESGDPIYESDNYFSYLWRVIKSHSAYKIFEKYSNYFSRFRLISRIFKIVAFIFIALQTSAILFITVVILSLVFPPIIIGFAVLLLCSAVRFPHDGRILRHMIKDKSVIVLFPPRQCDFGNEGFLYRHTRELAHRGYAVITVSPFMLSARGISENSSLYINLRCEDERIFTVRRQYFFFMNKRILKKHEKRVIYIY